jgi:hypothetical protein
MAGGGAIGGSAPQSGSQGNNSGQQAMSGMPMASPMDSFIAQAGQQQQNQQFNQPPAGGFGSLGTIQQTAQNNPTSTQISPFGSGDMSVMGDNGRLSGQGQQQGFPTQQLGQLNSLLRGQDSFDPAMEGSPSYGTFSSGMRGYTSPQQNSMLGLYSGSGGVDPQIQQQKQQGFGFGGAYGQQAQSRMQSQYQPQQSAYQQQPQQYQGLYQLLNRMMGGYQNRPQYGAQPSVQQSLPAYTSPASTYKPDFVRAQEALNRTATSQANAQAAAAKSQTDAEALTEDEIGFRNWQRQQYEASKNSYGGGG